MRVRNVVTRTGRHFRGKFPSVKLQTMVHWESLLERDAILHLEYHPLVVGYQEQPCEVLYYDREGQVRRYIPDFRAELDDGSELLIEVKPKAKLEQFEIKEKLAAVALRLEQQGRPFHVWTEEDIRREPLFTNLKRIHEATRHSMRERGVAAPALSTGDTWTLGSFIRAMASETRAFALLGLGHVRANLEAELDEASVVCLDGVEGGHDGAFRI